MQQAMAEGRITSRELIEAHLLRIALYEEDVNAVIAINTSPIQFWNIVFPQYGIDQKLFLLPRPSWWPLVIWRRINPALPTANRRYWKRFFAHSHQYFPPKLF